MVSKYKNNRANFKVAVTRIVLKQGLAVGQEVSDINVGSNAPDPWVTEYLAEKLRIFSTNKPIVIEE